MEQNKNGTSFFGGAGFYIVLFLALAIIGASGYFIINNVFHIGQRNDPPRMDIVENAEHPLPDIEVHEDITLPQPSPGTTAPVAGTARIPAESGTNSAADTGAKAEKKTTDTRILPPLEGNTVTPFSMDTLLYNATMDDWRTHNGIDIAAAEDSAVTAAAAGKVLSVTDDYWLGTTVCVECADGYVLTYASLQGSPAVSEGDTVAPGDMIGTAGASSILEEDAGVHLHFSVTKDGVFVDPTEYLKRAG